MSYIYEAFIQLFQTILKDMPMKFQSHVHHCYHVSVKPEWVIQKRSLHCFFAVYIIEGKGIYDIDGKQIAAKPGRVILIDKTQHHSIIPNPDKPLSFISVHFELQQDQCCLNSIGEPFMFFDFGFQSDIRQLFHEISYTFRDTNIVTRAQHLHLLLSALLLKCFDQAINNSYSPVPPQIHRAKSYIDQNYTNDISLERLSSDLGMSRKHFSRLFKKAYLITPKGYIILKRIDLAKYLIEQTDMPLLDIAEQLNYIDYYAFSNQFKKNVGLSPKYYRSNRNGS